MGRRPTPVRLVRYVPGNLHNSPAWMPRERAERLLAEDDRSYLDLCDQARRGAFGEGSVADVLRRLGVEAPRIEVPS